MLPEPPAFPYPSFLGLQLQTQQSEAHDASCLPALKVSDIEPSVPYTELAVALAGQYRAATGPGHGREYAGSGATGSTQLPTSARPR